MSDGRITFVQSHRPPLEAGEYVVSVQQHLHNTDCTDPQAQGYVDSTYTHSRRFAVQGPRFVLPDAAIATVFPPPDNQGEYANCLAHAVFNSRTLPWTRPGGPAGEPWLAVLLFSDADPEPTPRLQTLQVADLLKPPDDVASYADAARAGNTKFTLDHWEHPTDPCQAIDVPLTTFNRIAPGRDDLPWLAHVRTVSADAKAGQPPPQPVDYSVVIGNRLPLANTRCTAHLVSLEGMRVYLPAGEGYRPATIVARNGREATAVRLVSLWNWRFTSVEPRERFSGYLLHVDPAPLQRPFTGTPESDAERTVQRAFDLGYTPVTHATRRGDRTVSWYRGPLVPHNVSGRVTVPVADPSADPPKEGAVTADELVRYDPTTQMFDPSYAAAWQLGRLLALQDRRFSIALYNWKRAIALKTAAEVEQQIIDGSFGAPLTRALRASDGEPAERAGAILRAAANLLGPILKDVLTDGNGPAPARLAAMPRHYGRPRRRRLLGGTAAFTALAATVASPARLADIHADTTVPDDVAAWLGRLKLLHGVPFNYLVPDAAMLPVESLRFFQLDLNWTRSLLEGAFSIGRSSSADTAHDNVVAARVHAAAHTHARQLRKARRLFGAAPAHVSGFLLRSDVVAGWPALEVRAFDLNGNELATVLRMERLAPTLLIFIVEGLIDRVAIQEPSEGLHFGADATKPLRYITVPAGVDKLPGNQIDDATPVPVPMFASRVLKIDALATALRLGLKDATGNAPGTFTSAEFALEMVEGVENVTFARKR